MKYKSKPTEIDGIKFASKMEANRYVKLKELQRENIISNLELQPSFLLQDGFTRDGKKYRPIVYVADFRYKTGDKVVVEDVKGFKTPFEHSIYERLRFKHGFYSMMYASRRAGINILMKALNSLANDEPMPSQEEINTAIENNNLTNISNKKEEKQVKERIKYKQLSEKYSIILHRKVFQLITQNRVKPLNVII